jgi:lysophospholipase L1-like esterase
MTPEQTADRLGVLAFGDSITNGGGELQWGVALQSWALWVARGLGLPFTSFAFDGATAREVVEIQVPAHERRSAIPDPRYHLGCVYIGINDIRGPGWDPESYSRDLATALAHLAARCTTSLVVTAPLRLGRPPTAPGRIEQLNALIERRAADTGALVLDLRRFGARNYVMADRVHPTAFGQIAIAEQALNVLGDAGLPTLVAPASLISYRTTAWGRLRGDATYVYRSAKHSYRMVRIRLAGARSPR